MIVLGIESTCDETAASIVVAGKEILSNVVASQADLHATYGGVVPELASRRHIDVIIPIIEQALEEAKLTKEDLDLIAVAHGPGLMGAILVGLNTAKAIAYGLDIPFVGVNHIEAHLYACVMSSAEPLPYPSLGVVVSGGHSSLVRVEAPGQYSLIGQTIDDAVGEAFDKVARLLGLPYPGGPAIEKLALKGDPTAFSFKAGRVKERPYDFSFSGLKTAVLYAAKGVGAKPSSPLKIEEAQIPDVAAAFQEAALGDVSKKVGKAIAEFGLRSVVVGGGVSHNKRLRALLDEVSGETPVFWPAPGLSLDNAAMIAGLGYQQYIQCGADPLSLQPSTRIAFTTTSS